MNDTPAKNNKQLKPWDFLMGFVEAAPLWPPSDFDHIAYFKHLEIAERFCRDTARRVRLPNKMNYFVLS
ncbi:MAG: hypothetical protein LBM75_02965 [Myxococcales bacterium]|jgi:hypothetical protein|nr:hypothetical protein [Myxococcales bacterium]